LHIFKKASPRLYFLKLLRRAGLVSISADDLRYFYVHNNCQTCEEYGCVAWNHNLPISQSGKLESVQKRTLKLLMVMLVLECHIHIFRGGMHPMQLGEDQNAATEPAVSTSRL